MAQFGPVAPIQILEQMLRKDPLGLFGTYHLMLAHHTAEESSRFSKLIRDFRQKVLHKRLVVIMDNSAVELQAPVDDQMIGAACDAIDEELLQGHDCVIPCLPDIIGDGPSTVEASTDAYHNWIGGTLARHPFMVVLQGKNWDEFTECANHFLMDKTKFPRICYVGIPRVITKSQGSREAAVRYIQMIAPHVKIHLFGFSDNMVDDFNCARTLGVMGIDSAVPMRTTRVMAPTDFVPSRDPAWFEKGILGPHHEVNVYNVRRWIGETK